MSDSKYPSSGASISGGSGPSGFSSSANVVARNPATNRGKSPFPRASNQAAPRQPQPLAPVGLRGRARMRPQVFASRLPKERGGPSLRRRAIAEPPARRFQRLRLRRSKSTRRTRGRLQPAKLAAAAIGDQFAELQSMNPPPHQRESPIAHQPFERAATRRVSGQSRAKPRSTGGGRPRRSPPNLGGDQRLHRGEMLGKRPPVVRGRRRATPPQGQDSIAFERHDLQRKRAANSRLRIVAMQLMNAAPPRRR